MFLVESEKQGILGEIEAKAGKNGHHQTHTQPGLLKGSLFRGGIPARVPLCGF